MSEKKLNLAGKVCLLLCIIGFCIPIFDEANVFSSAAYFFTAGQGDFYVFIGIVLTAAFAATSALALLSFGHWEWVPKTKRILTIVSAVLTVFSFIAVKKFTDEDVEFSAGFYFLMYGLAGYIIITLYSTLLGGTMSTRTEERRAYWMLALPAIIFYFGVMTFPSIFSVLLSLPNYSGGSLFER